MPVQTQNTGHIETIVKEEPSRPGDAVELVFRAHDDAVAPFNIRITAPSESVIVERVLRELPTTQPQSAPPVRFIASVFGVYKLSIWELYGTERGECTLTISETRTPAGSPTPPAVSQEPPTE